MSQVQVWGSSVWAALAAVVLKSRFPKVTWYQENTPSQTFRPWVFDGDSVEFLKSFISMQRFPQRLWMEAPQMGGMKLGNGQVLEFSQTRTVIEREGLMRWLRLMAIERGVHIANWSDRPRWNVLNDDMVVYDLSPAELQKIPQAAMVKDLDQPARVLYESTIWLPRVPCQKIIQSGVLEEVSGAWACLEPQGHEGWVLSLWAPHELTLKRAFEFLSDTRGHSHPQIRSFLLANSAPRVKTRKVSLGPNPYEIPGALAIGESLGMAASWSHFEEQFGVETIKILKDRLIPENFPALAVEKLRLSENWEAERRQNFDRCASWASKWDSMAISQGAVQQKMLQWGQKMPLGIRKYLSLGL